MMINDKKYIMDKIIEFRNESKKDYDLNMVKRFVIEYEENEYDTCCHKGEDFNVYIDMTTYNITITCFRSTPLVIPNYGPVDYVAEAIYHAAELSRYMRYDGLYD